MERKSAIGIIDNGTYDYISRSSNRDNLASKEYSEERIYKRRGIPFPVKLPIN